MTKPRTKSRRPQAAASKPRPSRAGSRSPWLLALLGVAAVTFALYVPALNNEFVNWDDNFYVSDNPLVAHPDAKAILTTPVAGNYHPLTIASLALNYKLSGLDPASYHWLNVLLHVANTLLVFLFVRALSRDRFWTSVVTALFFGIHPMHVESVAWVAERKDVLYTFFYMLGLIAYLAFVDRKRPLAYGAALVAMVLSVASKPAAVVFPLTLLAVDWFRKRPFNSRLFLEKGAFFAVALIAGIFTLGAQKATGVMTDPRPFGFFDKVLIACYGAMMYVVKLFVPVHLSAIYPHPHVAGRSMGPDYYLALLLVLIALPAALYVWRRNRPIVFGIAFFLINVVLVLQFFRVGGAVMADRYSYLPYVGLFFAIGWWLDEPRAGRPAGPRSRPWLAGALALLALFSLYQTWRRIEVWRDSETLWNDTIQKYPAQIYDAHVNRGYYLHRTAHRLDAALADFDQAIALNPNAATAWLNKGNLLGEMNQLDSAYVCFERALTINPRLTDAWNNRGVIRMRRGDLAGAISDLSRTIELSPNARDTYANRAAAYMMSGNYAAAIPDNRRALELDPANPNRYALNASIGEALAAMGRPREAIVELDEAIRLAPSGEPRLGELYLRRSAAWAALGDAARSRSDAQEAERRGARAVAR